MSLSTAEAELNSTVDGTVGLLSIEALLREITNLSKKIASDSTASLAILDGSGIWRTRHLRIRLAWLSEQLQTGNIVAEHCSGLKLVADLLSKRLSSHRTRDLLKLWGMEIDASEEEVGQPEDAAAATATTSGSPSTTSQVVYEPEWLRS